MAEADLDVVIRLLARQLHRSLITHAKERRVRFNALAGNATNKQVKDRYKQLAKITFQQAVVAAKRLQMSAENVADSYARSMRLATAVPVAPRTEKKAKKRAAKKDKA